VEVLVKSQHKKSQHDSSCCEKTRQTKPDHEKLRDEETQNEKLHDEELSGWLLVWGVKRSYRRFERESALLPAGTWQRWGIILFAGWLIAAGLTFGLAELLQRLDASGALRHEAAWLRGLVRASPMSFSSAIYLGVPTDTIFLVVMIVSATLLTLWRGFPVYALTIFASLVLPDLAVAAGWLSWNRPRPDVILGGIASPGLGSFPSGHVLQAIVIYGFLAYLWMEATKNRVEKVVAALLTLAVVALVSFARLELGVHWPSDVLVAFPIGAVLLVTLIIALRHTRAHVKRHNNPNA
jgi:membrane-associated phospholipid phosphatase